MKKIISLSLAVSVITSSILASDIKIDKKYYSEKVNKLQKVAWLYKSKGNWWYTDSRWIIIEDGSDIVCVNILNCESVAFKPNVAGAWQATGMRFIANNNGAINKISHNTTGEKITTNLDSYEFTFYDKMAVKNFSKILTQAEKNLHGIPK